MTDRSIVLSLVSGAVALLILRGHTKQQKAEAVNVNAGSAGSEATKAVTGQESHQTYQLAAGALTYDTRPDVAPFRGSWHVQFGDLDVITPTKEGRAMLEAALRNGNSRDIRIEVVPRATNSYMLARTGADREFPGLKRFVPRIYNRIVDWAVLRMR